jgi:hypothetical protein
LCYLLGSEVILINGYFRCLILLVLDLNYFVIFFWIKWILLCMNRSCYWLYISVQYFHLITSFLSNLILLNEGMALIEYNFNLQFNYTHQVLLKLYLNLKIKTRLLLNEGTSTKLSYTIVKTWQIRMIKKKKLIWDWNKWNNSGNCDITFRRCKGFRSKSLIWFLSYNRIQLRKYMS